MKNFALTRDGKFKSLSIATLALSLSVATTSQAALFFHFVDEGSGIRVTSSGSLDMNRKAARLDGNHGGAEFGQLTDVVAGHVLSSVTLRIPIPTLLTIRLAGNGTRPHS